MRECARCAIAIEGDWHRCPLCGAPTHGEPGIDPYPTVALEYSRRKLVRLLLIASAVVIAASLLAQLLFGTDPSGIGVGRSIWLGIITMWLVAVTAVRKRRNLAKSTVYFIVVAGALTAYWDYLTGWHGWALSYAIPSLCAGAILALQITVRILRVDAADHIVHTGLAVLLGLTPLVFLGFGWVHAPLLSLGCGMLSLIALAHLLISRSGEVVHELRTRLHL